jgi:hypothetical protein
MPSTFALRSAIDGNRRINPATASFVIGGSKNRPNSSKEACRYSMREWPPVDSVAARSRSRANPQRYAPLGQGRSEQAGQNLDQEVGSGRGRIGGTSSQDGGKVKTAGGGIAGTGHRLHEAAEVVGNDSLPNSPRLPENGVGLRIYGYFGSADALRKFANSKKIFAQCSFRQHRRRGRRMDAKRPTRFGRPGYWAGMHARCDSARQKIELPSGTNCSYQRSNSVTQQETVSQ